MTEREDPRIGPFSLQVPPPSPNGSRVEHGTLDPLRQAVPGALVAVILALSGVPTVALLKTASFAQWWRLVIATTAGGLSVGLLVRRSWPIAAVLGAAVEVIGLFIAYGLVRDQSAAPVPAATIAADLARLLAWSVAGGAPAAALGYAIRSAFVRRATSRTVKPVFPRSN
jgi:hypothetical protein